MGKITLVTGGARSGKSRYALDLTADYGKRVFIATAEPLDDEMALRIKRHRRERGDGFLTIEEAVDLAGAVRRIPADTDVTIIDCLTVWLGNLLHRYGVSGQYHEIEDLLEVLSSAPGDLVIVTNEVGMGIVPDTELSRHFRDTAGRLNAETARIADNVTLLVSGIPLRIKEKRA